MNSLFFAPDVRARVLRQAGSEQEGERRLALLERYFGRQIERARRFSWSLTVPVEKPGVQFIVFGSDCFPTPARMLVEEVAGESHLRLHPNEIRNPSPGVDYERMMLEPGDGTVTKSSLLARQTADLSVARHRFSQFRARLSRISLRETHRPYR